MTGIQVGYTLYDDEVVSSSRWTLEDLARWPHIEGLLANPDIKDVWLRFPGEWEDPIYVKGAPRKPRVCPTRTPEVHNAGEFPMTCYQCHLVADS